MEIKYETILARSFSRYKKQRLRYGALVVVALIFCTFCSLIEPYLNSVSLSLKLSPPLDDAVEQHEVYNLRKQDFSMPADMCSDVPIAEDSSIVYLPQPADIPTTPVIEGFSISQQLGNKTVETKLSCNFESRSDYCEIKGDIRIHGITSTIVIASPQAGNVAGNGSWAIIPYARKEDKQAMGQCRNWTLRSVMDHKQVPHCTVNHGIPAILFSTGGYVGNHFHDFSDVLIPLYITSKHFNREVQFLCSNMKSWWMKKHHAFLENLSRYDIIDIDREEEIHCFTSVIIGLKSHKELSIDPSKSPNGLSMKDFGHFLRSSFSLKRDTAIKLNNKERKRPWLMIIARRKSRAFLNEGSVIHLAKTLGFDVVVAEANTSTDLSQFAHTVNSCDVLVGVHGAGLTNMVFLPEKAILIQIVPWGIGWLAQYDFGGPAMEMNLKYLEYKIRPGESSLIEQYPLNHPVFQDPVSIHNQGWDAIRTTYLDNQNVKIDVCRFRATLLKAMRFLHK